MSTLDGNLRFRAHLLLSLASQTVRLLNTHYTQQYETALTTDDDDSEVESVENLNDVRVLFELGCIPKAFWVMPEAVKIWRESRGASVDGTEMESEHAHDFPMSAPDNSKNEKIVFYDVSGL